MLKEWLFSHIAEKLKGVASLKYRRLSSWKEKMALRFDKKANRSAVTRVKLALKNY